MHGPSRLQHSVNAVKAASAWNHPSTSKVALRLTAAGSTAGIGWSVSTPGASDMLGQNLSAESVRVQPTTTVTITTMKTA